MELIRGLGIMDSSFLIPVIVVAVIIFIVASLAKKLLKLTILIAVVALVATVYMNLPSFKVNDGTATLELSGKQYTISTKEAKVVTEQKDGKEKAILVSGTTRIELPFSKEFADKFITEKLKGE